MSGNYPDGFNQRMHDDYFDRPGPDPGDDEGCDRCLDDMGEHSEILPRACQRRHRRRGRVLRAMRKFSEMVLCCP